MNPWGFFLAACGLFSVAGGTMDWEWFMNHRKARVMCALLTRTGARVFYVLLGVALVVLGFLMGVGVIADAQ